MPATAPFVLDEPGDVGEPFRRQVERKPVLHLADGPFVSEQQTPREREVRVTLVCGNGREVADDRARLGRKIRRCFDRWLSGCC